MNVCRVGGTGTYEGNVLGSLMRLSVFGTGLIAFRPIFLWRASCHDMRAARKLHRPVLGGSAMVEMAVFAASSRQRFLFSAIFRSITLRESLELAQGRR